jgi:hypothetical protein
VSLHLLKGLQSFADSSFLPCNRLSQSLNPRAVHCVSSLHRLHEVERALGRAREQRPLHSPSLACTASCSVQPSLHFTPWVHASGPLLGVGLVSSMHEVDSSNKFAQYVEIVGDADWAAPRQTHRHCSSARPHGTVDLLQITSLLLRCLSYCLVCSQYQLSCQLQFKLDQTTSEGFKTHPHVFKHTFVCLSLLISIFNAFGGAQELCILAWLPAKYYRGNH